MQHCIFGKLTYKFNCYVYKMKYTKKYIQKYISKDTQNLCT